MAPRNWNIYFNHRFHISIEIEIEFIYIRQILWAKPRDATHVIIKYNTHFILNEVTA
jgi:hypothetical protein